MLDNQLIEQLKQYFERLQKDVVLALEPGEHEKREELKGMLEGIASASPRVTFAEVAAHSAREETTGISGSESETESSSQMDGLSFSVISDGEATGIRFRGIPGGHEFNSLILAILQAGGVPVRLDEDVIDMMAGLNGVLHFETVVSLDCHNCPDVVQTLNSLSLVSPAIRHDMIDGAVYPDVVKKYNVQGVPAVFLNGEPFSSGKVDASTIISRLMERAVNQASSDQSSGESNPTAVSGTGKPGQDGKLIGAKADATASAKSDGSVGQASAESGKGSTPEIFDVAIIGGGPGGVAAAIYSARKGLKVTVIADRLGGQVKDTMDIENLVAIPSTTGPKLSGTLAEQLKAHGVVVREHLRVESMDDLGDVKSMRLNTGREVRSRTVIVATGARWREMNVPGEMENVGRGVAFCPHCDGPFFKGKDVAVIGGGNSGVEAALDLAGITKSVTVLEFAPDLKADQVLQDRMADRGNISVIKSAMTTEVLANEQGVTGLRYTDRESGDIRELKVDGVFVQIGLLPNSGFAEGFLEMNRMGEILVDEKCQTNVPGVFACGDVTNVPYKQIVVALGHGATASLSAFDYLIRHAAPEPAKAKAGAAA
ncbi:MAG: alkyl hydroperoxide reductase subunit F [Spirochaetaceae bacterium]|nr:alkyl hydroperoxide reductase subunit F [Spirochaetaceae bacterium]|tara:strand:+ start:47991 stop:49787 length:1797 start_codon:yes stop_codon:yes gene_type:complete